jgi:hypothetical protein
MDWGSSLDIARFADKFGYTTLIAAAPLAVTLFFRIIIGKSRGVTVLFQLSVAWLVTKIFLLPHANAIESGMAGVESFLHHYGI